MISEKEEELSEMIYAYVDRREDLDSEYALGIFLGCRGDEAAQEMIDFLKEHPDIDESELLLKSVDIHRKYNKDQ